MAASTLKRRLEALLDEEDDTVDLDTKYTVCQAVTQALKSRVEQKTKDEQARQVRAGHLELLVQHLGVSRADAETLTLEVEDHQGYLADESWAEYATHFEDPRDIVPYYIFIELGRSGGKNLAQFELAQTFETDVGYKVYFKNVKFDSTFRVGQQCPFSVDQIKALCTALCPEASPTDFDPVLTDEQWA